VKKMMKKAVVVDGRNIYEKKELQELEIVYVCIGR
jgi:UDPglucose 6-dehydrogenase